MQSYLRQDESMIAIKCQVYRGYADQNLATMRKIVLHLLEKDKSSRSGVAIKRFEAALSTRFLRKVIGF